MMHRTLSHGLALALALQGCAAHFVPGASFSVTARGDARAAAAAGAVATGVALASAAQPGVVVGVDDAAVAQPAVASPAAGARVVVAQVTGLRVHAAGSRGRVQTLAGGAVALEHDAPLAVSDIVGGDLVIEASAVEGAPSVVSGGTVTLAGGASYRVSGGRVTLARNGDGAWIVASGRITTTQSATTTTTVTTATGAATSGGVAATGAGVGGGAGVAVASGAASSTATTTTTTTTATRTDTAVAYGRVTGVGVGRVTAGGGGHVVVGGEITVTGAPMAEGLTVVDGAIDFDDAELAAASSRGARVAVRATARRPLRVRAGGTVLVRDRRGRRWRARVEGGELVARTEGTDPGGRVVWEPLGGELRVTVTASGGDNLTLTGAALPEATVEFTPRVRGALDALVAAAPADSREALRLAAAVEVVVRQAESAEPSFYAIPIRGRTLVLMVDVSYSMSDPDPSGAGLAATPSKLDVARAELVKVLASAPAGVQVNVLAFSSTARTLWAAPRAVDDASLAEAVRWVAALRPQDETHPLEAVDAASAMHPDQLVMLSDGRPSDSEAVLRSLLARVDAIAPRTRVDVVGFGADQDRAFLASLAAHGHGTLRLR